MNFIPFSHPISSLKNWSMTKSSKIWLLPKFQIAVKDDIKSRTKRKEILKHPSTFFSIFMFSLESVFGKRVLWHFLVLKYLTIQLHIECPQISGWHLQMSKLLMLAWKSSKHGIFCRPRWHIILNNSFPNLKISFL